MPFLIAHAFQRLQQLTRSVSESAGMSMYSSLVADCCSSRNCSGIASYAGHSVDATPHEMKIPHRLSAAFLALASSLADTCTGGSPPDADELEVAPRLIGVPKSRARS